MTEQEQFFSPSHNRLLNIAMWAKYLAWVVLVIYIIWAALQMLQTGAVINNAMPQMGGWLFLLRTDPFRAFELVVNIAATVLRGGIYYLVLKGISLGLRMIVETDINYREQEAGAE